MNVPSFPAVALVVFVVWLAAGWTVTAVHAYREAKQRGESRALALVVATALALPLEVPLFGIAALALFLWKAL